MPVMQGGQTIFGHTIGVMLLKTHFPRIPGDVGNALTFPFPVRYRVVEEATALRVVGQKAEGLLEPFIVAAKELIGEGVRAITTSCGFLAIHQKALANAVDVPIFASSLLQVPWVHAMLRKDQKVGIITVDGRYLTEEHLAGVGATGVPIVLEGVEGGEVFTPTFVEDRPSLDTDKACADVVRVGQRMVEQHPEIGAFVLECANMPPYAHALQKQVRRPVFDIVTLTHWVYHGLVRTPFQAP
jgi:Asp/Glu/hydantoin racemase